MSDEGSRDPSTAEYLRVVFLNKVSLPGFLIMLGGILFLVVTGPDSGITNAATYGGGMILAGATLFALGFSKAQRDIADQSPDWSRRRE